MNARVSVLALSLLACNGPVETTDKLDTGADADTDTDVDSDTDVDVDTDTDSDTDTPATGDTGLPPLPAGPGIGGVLVDSDGDRLAGVMVQACNVAYCLTTDSEADGSFWFVIDPVTEVALKTLPEDDVDPRRGAALEGYVVIDDQAIDARTLCAPDLAIGAPVVEIAGPQTVDLGEGLELTLVHDDLILGFGQTLDNVAAGSVPIEHAPTYPDLGAEELVAEYTLFPFHVLSASPIEVRATTTLPAGTEVSFRTIDSLDGTLSDPVAGTSDGTFVSTDPGDGIYELSHLLISRVP